jgi:hypothetical protein
MVLVATDQEDYLCENITSLSSQSFSYQPNEKIRLWLHNLKEVLYDAEERFFHKINWVRISVRNFAKAGGEKYRKYQQKGMTFVFKF